MKYKVGDIIKNPSFEETEEILNNYEAEWIDIGVVMITKVLKKSEDKKGA